MNFNPLNNYFYYGYEKDIYQANYKTESIISYHMDNSELYIDADDVTGFS